MSIALTQLHHHTTARAYAAEYKNYIVEWKEPPIFQNKRVIYARADELELYSSSSSSRLLIVLLCQ